MTTRRELLLTVGLSALAAPFALFAQQQPARARLGFLGLSSATNPVTESRVDALRAGLRELGYTEGTNFDFMFRWADGSYDRLPGLAAELVRLKVDVLVTYATPGGLAAKQATRTIPIVMASVGDPVSTGLVASLARPGGNVTGLALFTTEEVVKRLELLKDSLPRARRVAVLWNPDNPLFGPVDQKMRDAAKSLKLDVRRFDVRHPNEMENAFSAMTASRVDAVLVIEDPLLTANAARIAEIATKKRLPSIGHVVFADAGGLIGNGANQLELFRRAAVFVDKILKGAKPADLPVEQPTKFELVINLKTAKALGIKIPQVILLRADRVIE